jgi:hypothetical protein
MRNFGKIRFSAGAAALMCGGLVAAGCDVFGGASVHTIINGAHHAVRGEDVKLPNYGEPDRPRIFTNDLGWTITLTDGFVVATAAKIEPCDGEGVSTDLPFGPFPEYWLDQDVNVIDFAGVDLGAAEYCDLIVEYGRYQRDVAVMAEDQPFPVQDAARLEGTTLWLAGYADKPDGKGGMVTKNFSFRSDQTVIVTLDLRTLDDGERWTITGDEPGGRNLTVLKTYDDFFVGVDFETVDQAKFEAELPARLARQTRVISGTSVY